MFTNPIRLPCTAAIFRPFTRFTTPKRTRFSLSFFFLSMFYSHTHTHTDQFHSADFPFSRVQGLVFSPNSDCTPITVCCCETMSLFLSPFFFSFFLFFWYSPICRLLTLCIRCNRVLVFRQAAFRKTVASFAALFSHSTRDPLEVGFAACARLPGKFGIAKVLETDDTIRWYRFRKSVKGCILFDSLAILKFNKHKHNVYVMGRFVSMSFFSVRNDSCASLSVRIWDLQLKFSYKREISMYTYEPLCDKIRITSYQFTCRVGQCGFGTTRS